MKKILVTGGAGFIGSSFVKHSIRKGYEVIVVDKLTYAGDLERLKEVEGKYKFHKADICDKRRVELIFKNEKPQNVVHFAAESHVDRSIKDATFFIKTNVEGTHFLLSISRKYRIKKFLHISTDEVYGNIKKGKFFENFPLKPNSPYSASKASADLFVRAYIKTYGFPAIIIRPCNNYGPWQYPEKLIPLALLQILKNKKILVYGDGKNKREWIYVDDCTEGIFKIMEKGKIGEVYNLGSGEEKQNIEVVKDLLRIFNKKETSMEFVTDRLGHDFRYALNTDKIRKEINWQAGVKFKDGFKRTIDWFIVNKDWILNK